MKDQIIPHLLRDRIIMYMKEHNLKVSQQQKTDYVQEIFETYFKILNKDEKDSEVYSLFFSIITNYDTFKWIRSRMKGVDEDKAQVYDFIKNHAYASNFDVRWKLDMSNLLWWRYSQHTQIQEDLDRLVFMLTGKSLVEVKLEVEQLSR